MGNFFSDAWDDAKDSISDLWDDVKDGDILGALENGLKVTASVVTFGTYNMVKVGFENLIEVPAPDVPEANYKDRKNTVRASVAPRKIIYGEIRTAGQLVFAESTGTDSETLHLVIVWASHKCEGISDIYLNDKLAISDGVYQDPFTVDNLVHFSNLGDQTSADTNIVNSCPSWTNNHVLRGQCYSYFQLTYNREVYTNGIPNITAVIKGRNEIYDPRTGGTSYTTNQALCCRDYLTWDQGLGVNPSLLVEQSFINGANVCDELVPSNTAGTEVEKRYQVNGDLAISGPPLNNLESLIRAGASYLTYNQGLWTYISGSYEAPPADHNFNESDLIGTINFTPGVGRSSRINTAKGTIVSPEHDYEAIDIVPVSVTQYVVDDLEKLELDIDFPFTTSATTARRLAKIAIERTRFGVRVNCTFKQKAMKLTVGSRLTVSVDRLSWDNKVFRVESIEIDTDSGVKAVLQEDGPEIYNWTEAEALVPVVPPTLNLPDPYSVTNPSSLNITQEQYTSDVLSRLRARVSLDFTKASDASRRFDIQFQETSGQWRYIAVNTEVTSHTVDNLGLGSYRFRVQAINDLGIRAQDWIESPVVTVVNLDNTNIDNIAPLFPITNFELENGTTFFDGKDAKFVWNNDNALLDYFLYYLVEVLDDQLNVIRTENISENRYVYTGEKNVEDGTNRTFTLRVRAVSNIVNNVGLNNATDPVTLTVSNPAPDLPSGLTLSPGFNLVNVSFVAPTDLDITNVTVWMSTSSGFTPNDSTLVATTLASPITIQDLQSNQTYYFRLSVNDTFGQGTVSAELSTTTQQATYPGLSPWATVTDVDRDFINANMENDAIESEKIVKLTASKIVTGTLASTQAITCEGTIEAISGPYAVTMGPRTAGSKTALFSFLNGSTPLMALYEDGSALFTGAIAIQSGSSGYSSLNDKPTSLSGINSTEGNKLGGIEAGATNTTNTNQLTDGANLGGTATWSGVSGAGKPQDNADVTNYNDQRVNNNLATPFSLIPTNSMEVVGRTLEKTSFTTSWDTSAKSVESYEGGATCSFIAETDNKELMIGLSDNPNITNSYTDIDYAFFLRADQTFEIRLSGANQGNFGIYVIGDKFEITYDGIEVKFYHNAILVFSSFVAGNNVRFYLDSSFYRNGAKVSAIGFSPYSNNNWSNINIPNRLTDNPTVGLNLTPSYMGHYNGSEFTSYIDSNGNFNFGSVSAGQFISFNGSVLQLGNKVTIGANEDITVTVGTDYATLNLALEALSRTVPAYKPDGFVATILIPSSYTETEQIAIDGLDLSWIRIESVDGQSGAMSASYTGSTLFKLTNGAKCPVIDISIDWSAGITGFMFKLENNSSLIIANRGNTVAPANRLTLTAPAYPGSGTYYGRLISAESGSSVVCKNITLNGVDRRSCYAAIFANASIVDCERTIIQNADNGIYTSANANVFARRVDFLNIYSTYCYATQGSVVNMRQATKAGTTPLVGLSATEGSVINAESFNCSGCITRGVQCFSLSRIALGLGSARIGATDSSSDIAIGGGGQVYGGSQAGGSNVTPNTISSAGIYFK